MVRTITTHVAEILGSASWHVSKGNQYMLCGHAVAQASNVSKACDNFKFIVQIDLVVKHFR